MPSSGPASIASSRAGSTSLAPPLPSPHARFAPPVTIKNVQATNTVSFNGVSIKTKIDPSLPVSEVIRYLCLSGLKVQEPAALFALRDDTDELVTDDNLRKKIEQNTPLRLVSAPVIEAAEMVDKMMTRDDKVLKLALFSLQKYIKEPVFAEAFLGRDGLKELVEIISIATGNTLAYALVSLQSLMLLDYAWEIFDQEFVSRIADIIVQHANSINICRPAITILKRLVVSGQRAGGNKSSSSSAPLQGFEVVWAAMQQSPAFLSAVVQRIESADTTLALASMGLINSLLHHVPDALWEPFTAELHKLKVNKAVVRLMNSYRDDELSSSILEFQAHVVRMIYTRRRTPVSPETNGDQREALDGIWAAADLPDPIVGGRDWTKLGFESSTLRSDFEGQGLLGLDCLSAFAKKDPERFASLVLEQNSRSQERRCPVAKMSNEVVDVLADYWQIYSSGSTTATTTSYRPFLLTFERVHDLVTRFFMRMWNDSGATFADFERVSALTRSQVKSVMANENQLSWFELEREFLESDYRTIRERQLQELELEDDVLSKPPIRTLRTRLYRDAFQFVSQQRINCLLEGGWFMSASSTPPVASRRMSRETSRSSAQLSHSYRFLRLSPNRRFIHWVDSPQRSSILPGLDDLPDRVDLSLVTAAVTGQSIPSGALASSARPAPSPLSILLLSDDTPLLDVVAVDETQFSEWVDGIAFLRDEGVATTAQTNELVQTLTDLGVKIKLLDLAGEGVEIPQHIPAPIPPRNTAFFFADL